MSRLLGILLSLVGYACVATVISTALGYGYLRKSGYLDNEKLFKVVALLQDVDLQEIKEASHDKGPEVPEEEPSYQQQQRAAQTTLLNFDAKQKQLAVSLVNFDYQLKQLNAAIDNYARLKDDVKNYLDEQGKLVLREAVQDVREQLELLTPKQAKPILISYIQDNSVDDVIMLLGSMKPKSREAILKTFTTDTDLEMLYRIQRKMLAGEPVKPFIDAKLQELEQLKSQD
ncbi:MAG TPA: hypothetical protein VF175_14940 [Lacipirellula sp.]